MQEENVEIVKTLSEGANVVSGLLAEVNPIFLGIPIITFAINSVLGFVSEKNIIKRIKKIEEKLVDKEIDIESFKKNIYKLSEHNEYIVRNNLNNLLLNAIPEVVDIYIELIIDLITNQENTIYEEICEILMSLNVNDLNLLMMIKEYSINGIKKEYKINVEKEQELEKHNKEIELENKEISEYNKSNKIKKIERPKYYDRNIRLENNTIFWNDFIETYKLKKCKLTEILLYKTVNDNKEESMEWAYIARSFLKLEKLGIIQMEYINTFGTINSLNIDRFHINLFGYELLNYISIKC